MDSGDCSPPPGSLCVDQTVIYDLYCPVPDVVHPLHPQHLILRLELFGDALTLCHLFYQQEHLLLQLVQALLLLKPLLLNDVLLPMPFHLG